LITAKTVFQFPEIRQYFEASELDFGIILRELHITHIINRQPNNNQLLLRMNQMFMNIDNSKLAY